MSKRLAGSRRYCNTHLDSSTSFNLPLSDSPTAMDSAECSRCMLSWEVFVWNKFKQETTAVFCSFFFGEKIVHLLLFPSNTTQPQPSCWWSHGVSHRRCSNKDERMQRENANLNAETGFGIFDVFFKQDLQCNPNIHLRFEKNLTHFLFFGGDVFQFTFIFCVMFRGCIYIAFSFWIFGQLWQRTHPVWVPARRIHEASSQK